MKEKIKKYWEEHDEQIVVGGVIAGAYLIGVLIGYKVGYGEAVRRGNIGFNMCALIKPELKPMLEEALNEVEKRFK